MEKPGSVSRGFGGKKGLMSFGPSEKTCDPFEEVEATPTDQLDLKPHIHRKKQQECRTKRGKVREPMLFIQPPHQEKKKTVDGKQG